MLALGGFAAQGAERTTFALTDHTGQAVTEADFRGRFMLVFFGYTTCPDICPIDLQNMAQALDLLGDDAGRIQPVFVTVDPARDTVEALSKYVPQFHPRLVGLTGSADAITDAAAFYKVRWRKFYPLPADAEAARDAELTVDDVETNYLIDHTAAMYLIGPDGAGLSIYNHGAEPAAIADNIRAYLAQIPSAE